MCARAQKVSRNTLASLTIVDTDLSDRVGIALPLRGAPNEHRFSFFYVFFFLFFFFYFFYHLLPLLFSFIFSAPIFILNTATARFAVAECWIESQLPRSSIVAYRSSIGIDIWFRRIGSRYERKSAKRGRSGYASRRVETRERLNGNRSLRSVKITTITRGNEGEGGGRVCVVCFIDFFRSFYRNVHLNTSFCATTAVRY